MRRLLTSLTLLMVLVLASFASQAQTCNACFTATPDSTNSYTIWLDGSCSTPASFTANFEWIIDGQSYIMLPYSTFQAYFNTPGTHTIDLVFSNGGCTDTASQTITVTAPCNAGFTSYDAGFGTQYFQTNQYSGAGTYAWDYGDGAAGAGPYTQHTYAASGTYNVCCIYSDTSNNCNDTSCQSVTVNASTSCNLALSTYVDPFAGYITAETYGSTFNPQNYQFNFYLNGTLVQSGSSSSYFAPIFVAGTYTVSATLSDTSGVVCDADSAVLTVTVPGGGTSSCAACFTTNYITNDSVMIDATCAQTQNSIYNWSINGGVYASGPVSFAQIFPAGYSSIALMLTDSNGNACDSMYSYVYVTPPPCNTCFTTSPVAGSTSDYTFDASCTGVSNNYYTWLVDNQIVTSGSSAVLNYSFVQSGTYTVCVQAYDQQGNFCNQTCSTLVVNTPTQTQFDINGTIYKIDGSLSYVPVGNNEAIVYLIKLQTGGQLDAIDSTTTNSNGGYKFDNKAIDYYRIKVALKTTSPDYSMNIPTYYQYSSMWYSANVVTLYTNLYGKDLYMNYGINTGGPGFISGNVFQGANKKARSGDRTAVTLLLIDVNTNQPIAYAKPNAAGDYSFGNLPLGQYKLMGELLNRSSITEDITIANGATAHTNKNFMFNDNVVMPTQLTLNVKTASVPLSEFSVSPNPAQSQFSLYSTAESAEITVYDITGKQVYSIETTKAGAITIDCNQWQAGIYLVEQVTSAGKSTRKLSKQ
jgi:hypothetical protein